MRSQKTSDLQSVILFCHLGTLESVGRDVWGNLSNCFPTQLQWSGAVAHF